ncbi:MAG TPA: hypothetical protein PLA90_08040 [Candidatus Sumerlaeota bacterium]|nr:hypothetical protein [Candidatus Sumerlaeota bacterium]
MKRVSERVSSDLFLILVSLAMACVVWLVVKENDLSQDTYDVPIKVVNAPPNVLTRLPRSTVQVTANVPKSIAARLHSGNFQIALDWETDLPSARSWCGASRFEASPAIELETSRNIISPLLSRDLKERFKRTIKILMIEPSSLRVEARYISRATRVHFFTRNRPPDGFRLVEPVEADSNYPEILVTATENRFAELDASAPDAMIALDTKEINLADRTESFSEPIELVLPPDVALVPGHDQLRARVRIEENQTTRTIEGVTILIPPPKGNLTPSYEPRVASVVLHGPERVIKSVKPSDLVVRPTTDPDETRREPQILDLMAAYSSSAGPNVTFMVEIRSMAPKTLMLQFREGAAPVPTPVPGGVPLVPPVQIPTPTPELISSPPAPTPTPERISVPPEPTPTPERISVPPPDPTPTPEPDLAPPKSTPTPVPTPLPTPERISSPPKPTPTPEKISVPPPDPTPTPVPVLAPPKPSPTPKPSLDRVSLPPPPTPVATPLPEREN